MNTIITLIFSVLGFLFLFFIFLVVLNYFNVISLNSILPTAKNLPKATPTPMPIFDKDTNSWKINATLYSYNNYEIKVKYYNQIINLKFSPSDSIYYTQSKSLQNQLDNNQPGFPGFFSDLEKPENIGKKIQVLYTKDRSGNNLIETIILYK